MMSRFLLCYVAIVTEVECSVLINNITSVSENTQTFSLDVYLNSYWKDYRLNSTWFTDDLIIPDK